MKSSSTKKYGFMNFFLARKQNMEFRSIYTVYVPNIENTKFVERGYGRRQADEVVIE